MNELQVQDWKEFLDLRYQLGQYTNNMNKEEFQEAYNKMRNQGVVYVYKVNGKIVATGKLLLEYKFNDNVGHIEDVVVDEKHRHKGYGTMIVHELTKYAQRHGCYKIILVTRDELEPFYSKAGLTRVGIHMSKTMEPLPSTIEIMFSGGLGNHIFNYNFAYMLAKRKNCALIFGPNNSHDECYQKAFQHLFPDAKEIGGTITHDNQLVIGGHHHDIDSYIRRTGKITLKSGAFQGYHSYIKPYARLIPEWSRINPDIQTRAEPGENDLVVHVRLADHGSPIEFFQKAIEMEPHNLLYIVSDRPKSSFVRTLAAQYNGIVVSRDKEPHPSFWYNCPYEMNHDFVVLTKAYKLVISQSTFSWWSAYLSRATKIYVPSYDYGGLWTERRYIDLLLHNDPRWVVLTKD